MDNTNLSLPYAESYWVIPNLLLAGEYPAGYDELSTRNRLKALIRCGMIGFLDLTHPRDDMPDYGDMLTDEANGYLKTVEYVNFPILDRSVPSIQEMKKILDHIDDYVNKGKPVYLHCIAGIGRTGTVVGCFLVKHGMNPTEALLKIRELRSSVPSGWARSPEADEQVNFILEWKALQ